MSENVHSEWNFHLIWIIYNNFHSKKLNCKCNLQNMSHSVQASVMIFTHIFTICQWHEICVVCFSFFDPHYTLYWMLFTKLYIEYFMEVQNNSAWHHHDISNALRLKLHDQHSLDCIFKCIFWKFYPNCLITIMNNCSRSWLTTKSVTWWRHQMETYSALLTICAGNSPVPGEFPTQRPVTQSFHVFFDLCPNKRSKQWWGWWFETPSCPLWCPCDGETIIWANDDFVHCCIDLNVLIH